MKIRLAETKFVFNHKVHFDKVRKTYPRLAAVGIIRLTERIYIMIMNRDNIKGYW